jgi:2,4-dienoyl-CoA reductase-like NADH-dependent reductase (Old Yellow Enzyme family)
MPYPLLFSPLRIGPIELRNRIVMGAHSTLFSEPNQVYGEPGYYGRRMGAYVGDRAKGGAGAVIVGQTAVHPSTAYQLLPNPGSAWEEAAIPHFEDLTSQVHDHGAKAMIQLTHNGGVNQGAYSKLPVLAPSAITAFFEVPKPLEKDEIRELVEYHAICARNAARGGFDGIEVQAAHGYLIHQFLSGKYNKRTDEYGGSLENRMRFCVEVLEEVREAVADFDVAVGLRLVGDDDVYGGELTPDDAQEMVEAFDGTGLSDFYNMSVGISGIGMVRTNYAEHLSATYAAAAAKKGTDRTPVFAVQRIITPDEAEGILERGEADAITLVRALIADPEWANKAKAGKADTIRLCTGSNQACIGNLMMGAPINCVQNPAVGREEHLGLDTLEPAAKAKRVVVVGGGPAGLEAAWVAAARGHSVTLLERATQLGGKIRLAEQLPGRRELSDFANWRAGEAERRGVDIRLGVDATADAVLALQPDAVVVATGGRATIDGSSYFHPMPVPGSEQPWVLDHETALRRALDSPDSLGTRIVILDGVGHIEAIGLGELLAAQGREVVIVAPTPTPLALDMETSAAALPRAVNAGAKWQPNTVIGNIGDHEVLLVDALSQATETVTEVDTVVIRTHGTPVDDLYYELKDRVPEVLRVGDAVAVRYCDRAIYDGHNAGRAL